MPYLTPDSAPSGTICRTLVIPDDPNWKAIVNGALSELIYAHRFEQFGTATPDEVAAVFQQMFYDYLESECLVPVDPFIIGEVRYFGTEFSVPDGWLMCQGQLLSRTTYADLFAVLGDYFDVGDGTTTFGIPNLIGRVPFGHGGAYVYGQFGGEAFHTLTIAELPAHSHTGVVSPNNPVSNRAVVSTGGVQTVRTAGTSDNSGSGDAHENRPPYLVLTPAIYSGVLGA